MHLIALSKIWGEVHTLKSWPKAIFLSFILAILIELAFEIFLDSIFEATTDISIDLSDFEGMRGNFITYIIMLLIGWVVGGFIEEITFRGYLITRLKKLLGNSPLVLFFILVLTSAAFGISHLYQGLNGVLSTGFAANPYSWFCEHGWIDFDLFRS